jgi:hypothetical protein
MRAVTAKMIAAEEFAVRNFNRSVIFDPWGIRFRRRDARYFRPLCEWENCTLLPGGKRFKKDTGYSNLASWS